MALGTGSWEGSRSGWCVGQWSARPGKPAMDLLDPMERPWPVNTDIMSHDHPSSLIFQTQPLAGRTSFWPKGLGLGMLEWTFLNLKSGLASGKSWTSYWKPSKVLGEICS